MWAWGKAQLGRFSQLWRYYGVGVINTLFGVGLYSGLVYFGLNLYIAQIIGHVLGVAFNYFMFSRHVFRGTNPKLHKFIITYVGNYFVRLGLLALMDRLLHNPYTAGLAATLIVSVFNYFALKKFVFNGKEKPAAP